MSHQHSTFLAAGGELRIRPLRAADLPEVLRIQAQCYTAIEPESARSLRAKIEASPGTCFLAQAGTGAVGYLIAVPVRHPHLPALDAPDFELAADADTLYLHDLAVAAEGRGTGAGKALVHSARAAGFANGLRKACLIAIQDSVPYWKRFDFEAVPPRDAGLAAKVAGYGAGAQLMAGRL